MPGFVRFQTSMFMDPFGFAIQAVVDVILYIELLFKLFSTYCDLKILDYSNTLYYKTFCNYVFKKILNRIKVGEKGLPINKSI